MQLMCISGQPKKGQVEVVNDEWPLDTFDINVYFIYLFDINVYFIYLPTHKFKSDETDQLAHIDMYESGLPKKLSKAYIRELETY